jgi:hypothetical protein
MDATLKTDASLKMVALSATSAEEWGKRYEEEKGCAPKDATQLRSFALARGGQLSFVTARELIRQICDGLENEEVSPLAQEQVVPKSAEAKVEAAAPLPDLEADGRSEFVDSRAARSIKALSFDVGAAAHAAAAGYTALKENCPPLPKPGRLARFIAVEGIAATASSAGSDTAPSTPSKAYLAAPDPAALKKKYPRVLKRGRFTHLNKSPSDTAVVINEGVDQTCTTKEATTTNRSVDLSSPSGFAEQVGWGPIQEPIEAAPPVDSDRSGSSVDQTFPAQEPINPTPPSEPGSSCSSVEQLSVHQPRKRRNIIPVAWMFAFEREL